MTYPPVRKRRLPWAWLIPLFLLVFWIAASNLNADAVWLDEYSSIEDAGGPPTGPLNLAQIWRRVATTNPWHTSGFFMLLNGWGRLVGWEPASLRALSLFAGLLALAWTYRLGRDVVSPRVGLYAALVLGVSAFFAHFLHELRMYTIATALAAFEAWIYIRIVSRRPSPSRLEWLGLFLGAVALLYTHYFAVMPLLGLCVYHLFFVKKDRRWWQVVIAFGLAGLCFVPWLGALLAGLRANTAQESLHERSLPVLEALEQWVRLLGNGAWLLLAAALGFALFRVRGAFRYVLVVAVVAVTVTLGVTSGLKIMHLGRLRYLLPAWPMLSVILGYGLLQIERSLPRSLGVARHSALILWVGVGVVQTLNVEFTRALDGGYMPPINRASPFIRALHQPDDLVVVVLPDGVSAGSLGFDRISKRQYFREIHPDNYKLFFWNPPDTPEYQTEIDFLVNDVSADADLQRVWFTYAPDQDNSAWFDRVMPVLQSRFHQCPAALDRGTIRLDQYARSPVCCLSEALSTTPDRLFGDGIGLVRLDVTGAQSGEALRLGGLWSMASDVPPYLYSASYQLFDAAGNKVGQGDHPLTPQPLTCEQAELPIAGLPPGDYDLRVAVYNWQTGERLAARTRGSDQTADSLPVQIVGIGR